MSATFRLPRRAAALFAIAAGAAFLSACTVTTVDPEAPQSTAAAPAGDGAAPDNGSDTRPDERLEPEESEPPRNRGEGFSAAGQTERQQLIDRATATMLCPAQLLDKNSSTTRVEGHCESLVLAMDLGAVVADDVDHLTVTGNDILVYVENVKMISLEGERIVVRWAGPTPTVDDQGSYNLVTPG